MKRKIYEELKLWKEKNILTPLMVIGARQIGKTYTINEFCNNEFENYIYINLLEHPEIIKIFEQKIETEEKYNRMQLSLDIKINFKNTIIFFDEIQESEEIISSFKYCAESEIPYKIICAGSLLGVKIHRFNSSFPVGKVKIINMNPMNFEEFLLANNGELLIKEINKCYTTMSQMDQTLHEKLLNLYRTYLCVGGMPEAVKNIINNKMNILEFDDTILKNIITSYLNDMNKYITNNYESIKIEAIYKSIPIQLGNNSNKFQYSKINKNARSRDYESAVEWLLSSNMVYECLLLKKAAIPPKAFIDKDYFKLYLSDIGLLNSLLEIKYNEIILDKAFEYKGVIVENYIAEEFVSNNISLYYWNSSNIAEVDFIIYNSDGLIPIEVKAGQNTKSKSLNEYVKKNNPKYSIRISTKNFGFENNIKSIPLYAVFCIK